MALSKETEKVWDAYHKVCDAADKIYELTGQRPMTFPPIFISRESLGLDDTV
jgi:hypothetical protein